MFAEKWFGFLEPKITNNFFIFVFYKQFFFGFFSLLVNIFVIIFRKSTIKVDQRLKPFAEYLGYEQLQFNPY